MAQYPPNRLEVEALQQRIDDLKLSIYCLASEAQMFAYDDPSQILTKIRKINCSLTAAREKAAWIRRSAAEIEKRQRTAFEGKAGH